MKEYTAEQAHKDYAMSTSTVAELLSLFHECSGNNRVDFVTREAITAELEQRCKPKHVYIVGVGGEFDFNSAYENDDYEAIKDEAVRQSEFYDSAGVYDLDTFQEFVNDEMFSIDDCFFIID